MPATSCTAIGPGDVLVFLPGEREIRDAAEALRNTSSPAHRDPAAVCPPVGRGAARIFKPHSGRRIVLATNVAETSLTVPGIRYVVDTGLARVKRYSYRNKVEQLQVEKISQAAANQRAGRCGRVAAGVCIRLYDEEDFNTRRPYTDPEILRSSLAGVILRMKALKLGDVEEFPLPRSPAADAGGSRRLPVAAGARRVDDDNVLTPIGQGLAKLPLDPRIARMIVAARDGGCLHEVLVIAAASRCRTRANGRRKSRARPMPRTPSGPTRSRSSSPGSSCGNGMRARSSTRNRKAKLVQTCHAAFLSANRMREWRDTHSQLHALIGEQGWKENEIPATFESIHKALLTGLLGNVGCRSEDSMYFLGARGIKFLIHPSVALAKEGRQAG
jgi:ATP-dependent helicase HrpA